MAGEVVNTLKELYEFITRDKGIILRSQGIVPDHVHLFITAYPKFALITIVRIMKDVTAKKFFETHPELRIKCYGKAIYGTNPSYYVGTCGDVTRDGVQRYIETQKAE